MISKCLRSTKRIKPTALGFICFAQIDSLNIGAKHFSDKQLKHQRHLQNQVFDTATVLVGIRLTMKYGPRMTIQMSN